MNINKARIEAFSDGIIAIVITIMILELKLPDFAHRSTTDTIKNELTEDLPYFGAYVFSFFMVAILWINHHHHFHLMEKLNSNLVWQNFLFLFWASLIPFTTALIGANPLLSISVALYGGVLLMTSFSLAVMRAYAMNKQLMHRDKDKALTREIAVISRREKVKTFLATAAYLAAVVAAYINIYVAYFFLLIPPILFFLPNGLDNEDLANRVIEKNNA